MDDPFKFLNMSL